MLCASGVGEVVGILTCPAGNGGGGGGIGIPLPRPGGCKSICICSYPPALACPGNGGGGGGIGILPPICLCDDLRLCDHLLEVDCLLFIGSKYCPCPAKGGGGGGVGILPSKFPKVPGKGGGGGGVGIRSIPSIPIDLELER